MVIRLYPRWLLSLALLVIAACGTEEPYDELGIKQCSVQDETMCGNIYTEDLLIPHNSLYKPVMNMVTIDALRDYLLQKENVSKTSPFRTIGDEILRDVVDFRVGVGGVSLEVADTSD